MSFDFKEGMKGVVALVVALLLLVVVVFVFGIIGALIGAVSGFIVGITPFLGGWVIEGFALLGFTDINLVSVGAAIGFVGMLFKSINMNNNNK